MSDKVKLLVWAEVIGSGERIIEVPRADLYDADGNLMEDAAEGYAEAEQNNMTSYGWKVVE